MYVEANKVSFLISGSFSLKDKRSVVKSMINKLQNKFNVSVSEVDDQELLNKATIGIALVSNNAQFNKDVFESIITFIESNYEVEIILVESYY